MGSPWDQNSLAGRIAEGDAKRYIDIKSKYDSDPVGGQPHYVRMVVIEVISDPSVIDQAKLSYWEHTLNVSNIEYASVAPRNSIIARRVLGNNSPASGKTMVMYPFFPPSFAFPAKPGEHVWTIFENPDAKVNELGYWMCRIVGPHFVEDVNHTHADRQFDPSFVPSISDVFEGKDDPKYEFPNGVVNEKDGERFAIGATASLDGDEKAYETLLKDTDASKQIKFEPVPRYKKRPSDTALEGSNNTLIVLGTERNGPVSDYTPDPEKGKIPKKFADDPENDEGTGIIDIVVGRGQTERTGGKKVKNSIDKKELGKSKKDLVENEGDVDLKNDRSRILVAQTTHGDKNFKIDTVVKKHTSKKEVKDAKDGNGYITLKSDKLRFVARQDIVFLVTGALETDENGNVKDPDVDPDKCASVIIRTNGDIIFTPSKEGILKLGGDDADKAILCTTVNNKGVGGTVTASPIVDTMAGSQGGSDGLNGTFSSKILVK